MELLDIYRAAFQARGQFDATDPMQRTQFDEFGLPKDAPTVEGFDNWGPNQYQKPVVVEDRLSVEVSCVDARLAHNRGLLRLKPLKKGQN